jgi:hypothetical protein
MALAGLSPVPAADKDDATLAIVNKYLDASKTQRETLRGAEMEMEINAKLPRLEKQGKMRLFRKISRLGQITYKVLGFMGDDTIKKEVIARYLATESEARDNSAIAITPANYKFKYRAQLINNGHEVQIFHITPRRKAPGLFQGELWLDAATGMPLRESGRLVKNPSVFLKKVEFVHEYEIHDGVAIPKHFEGTADVRLVGRAELTIEFSNFKQETAEEDVSARNRNQ